LKADLFEDVAAPSRPGFSEGDRWSAPVLRSFDLEEGIASLTVSVRPQAAQVGTRPAVVNEFLGTRNMDFVRGRVQQIVASQFGEKDAGRLMFPEEWTGDQVSLLVEVAQDMGDPVPLDSADQERQRTRASVAKANMRAIPLLAKFTFERLRKEADRIRFETTGFHRSRRSLEGERIMQADTWEADATGVGSRSRRKGGSGIGAVPEVLGTHKTWDALPGARARTSRPAPAALSRFARSRRVPRDPTRVYAIKEEGPAPSSIVGRTLPSRA
jgi:hypothetical protein